MEALLQSDSSDEDLGGQALAGLIFGQVRHDDNIADNTPLHHDNAAAAAESVIDSSESGDSEESDSAIAAALALQDSDSIHSSDEISPGASGPSFFPSSHIENDESDEDAVEIFDRESDGSNERALSPDNRNPFNEAFFISRVRPEWFQDEVDDDDDVDDVSDAEESNE